MNDNAIDINFLRTWIGKTRTDEDLISLRHARLMSATSDYCLAERIEQGEPLPPLWHWIYFLDALPSAELGRDGHPARGGFLPPVPLPNRMWAGGRVSFLKPIPIGSTIRKESRILNVEHKAGRSGDLVFVTVLHTLASPAGAPLLREEHDIVYKGQTRPAKPSDSVPAPASSESLFSRVINPTSTTLFRYSALTFNGHRIHYDADYCRDVEGYPNLVIHGPLVATWLANLAEEIGQQPLAEFSYRGLAPALLGETITLHADRQGDRVELCATLSNGTVSMRAEARLASH